MPGLHSGDDTKEPLDGGERIVAPLS